MIILYALAGGFFNSFFRGGFIKQWLPNFKGGKIINAVAFGGAAYLAHHNPLFAACMAVAMYIGQAPALFHDDTDRHKANGDMALWALVVAERGLIWSIPLMAVSWPMFGERALIWAALAVVMPMAYSLDWTKWPYKWVAAEVIFGLAMWALLGI